MKFAAVFISEAFFFKTFYDLLIKIVKKKPNKKQNKDHLPPKKKTTKDTHTPQKTPPKPNKYSVKIN